MKIVLKSHNGWLYKICLTSLTSSVSCYLTVKCPQDFVALSTTVVPPIVLQISHSDIHISFASCTVSSHGWYGSSIALTSIYVPCTPKSISSTVYLQNQNISRIYQQNQRYMYMRSTSRCLKLKDRWMTFSNKSMDTRFIPDNDQPDKQ